MSYIAARALELLRLGTQNPAVRFREGQEEAVRHVVEGRGRLLVVHPSNITRLLQNLRRTGLVAQVDSPADRRQVVVALTPAGRSRWAKANRDYQEGLRACDHAISKAATERGAGVLKKLHDISHELFH